jgi:hypothetical protein
MPRAFVFAFGSNDTCRPGFRTLTALGQVQGSAGVVRVRAGAWRCGSLEGERVQSRSRGVTFHPFPEVKGLDKRHNAAYFPGKGW